MGEFPQCMFVTVLVTFFGNTFGLPQNTKVSFGVIMKQTWILVVDLLNNSSHWKASMSRVGLSAINKQYPIQVPSDW